jgi:hypothetical protein
MSADMIRQRLQRKGVHPQYRAGAILKDRGDFKNGRLNLVDAFDSRYFEFLIHRSRALWQRYSGRIAIPRPTLTKSGLTRPKPAAAHWAASGS